MPSKIIFGYSRFFSSSSKSLGLYQNYLSKLNTKEITPKELKNIFEADPINGPPAQFHLLDVRETYEWNEDHIPFAQYTGRGNLERDIEGIVPDVYDQIVLYCAAGHRSKISADSLTKMGYKNVSSLQGGIGAWKQAGHYIATNTTAYSERVKYGKNE